MFRRKRSAKDFAEEIKTHLELDHRSRGRRVGGKCWACGPRGER